MTESAGRFAVLPADGEFPTFVLLGGEGAKTLYRTPQRVEEFGFEMQKRYTGV